MTKTKLEGDCKTVTPRKRHVLPWLLVLLLTVIGYSGWGQITVDGNPEDWCTVFGGSNTNTLKGHIPDRVDNLDNIWTGGSANANGIYKWAWTTNGSNDKNNITNAGFYVNTEERRIYFFADRVATNGDASIGFWLLKGTVTAVAGGTFSGSHQDGDILLVSHFVNGGSQPDITAYRWTGDDATGSLALLTTTGFCDAGTGSHTVAAVNFVDRNACPGWNYVPKGNGTTAGVYPPNAFFEGYIDLCLVGPPGGTGFDACFSTFIVETSNSQSTTSSMEDLVIGRLGIQPLTQTLTGSSACAGAPGANQLTLGGTETSVIYEITNSGGTYTTVIGTGGAITLNNVPAGTYSVTATQAGGFGCTTTFGPATVIVNSPPGAPSVTTADRCGAGSVTFNASGCTGTVTWYSASTGGTVLGTGTTLNRTLAAGTSTTVWASCTNSDGCEGPRGSATANAFAVPAAPSVTTANRCGAGTVTFNAAGCTGTVTWYSASSGGTVLGTGSSLNRTLAAGTSTTVWASCTNSDGCEGPRGSATANAFNVPTAPSVTTADRCGAGTVTFNAAGCTGTVTWYSAETEGTILGTGSSLNRTLAAGTSTTVWASCTNSDGCEGPRGSATANAFNVPVAPTVTTANRCGAGTVTFNASGCTGTVTWYSASSGGTVLGTGSSLNRTLAAGTSTTVWASCTNSDGCEGPRGSATANAFNVPTAPSVTTADRCGAGTVTFNASGCTGTVTWYSASSGGTVLGTGSSLNRTLAAGTSTTVWASCTNSDGCEGPRGSATANAFNVPAAPSVTTADRCGAGTVTFNAAGCTGTVTWYSASSGGTVLGTGSSLNRTLAAGTSTTVWASCTNSDGCEGPRGSATANAFEIPVAPSVTTADRCGAGTVTFNAAGCTGTVTWYSASSGGTVLGTGSSLNRTLAAGTSTTVWASCTLSTGCESPRNSATANAFNIPVAPSVTTADRCGAGTVTFNASGCTGTVTWYSASSGGTVLGTGSSLNRTLAAGTSTTVWASCTNSDGCEGPRGSATANAFNVPAAPSVTTADRCGAGTVTFNAAGCTGTVTWYSASSGGTILGTGSSLNRTLAAGTSTTVWASCTNSDGCEGSRGSATATAYNIPTVSATATPTLINLFSADHMSTLNATSSEASTFSWSPVSGAGLTDYTTGLSGTTGTTVTFTAPNVFGAQYRFMVTATTDAGGCVATATVDVFTNAGFNCPIVTGPGEICAGTEGVFDTGLPSVPEYQHYSWSATGATISGSNTGTSVTVVPSAAGTYTVTLTVSFDNTSLTPEECNYNGTAVTCGSNCSYTQGYYGNPNGKSCDGTTGGLSTADLINGAIGGGFTVGSGSHTIWIPANSASTIIDVLPGGGASGALTHAGTCTITNSCFNTYLTRQGRINNNLLSQTITLSLNVRLNGGSLADFPLGDGYLVTMKQNGCGEDATVSTCEEGGTYRNTMMNSNVYNYLTNSGATDATVQDLLDLANAVLGGTLVPGVDNVPSFSDIEKAVDAYNNAFDGCAMSFGYSEEPWYCPETTETITNRSGAAEVFGNQLTVVAAPNPFFDRVRFTISTPVDGNVQLEIVNMLGQKVASVYKGFMKANTTQVVEYRVPSSAPQNLIYILRSGNEQVTGKLLKADR